jgi:FkbM family methyltransferase
MKSIKTVDVLKNINNGVFVQIGSYDGISNDEYGLKEKIKYENHKSILIEPIKEFFDKLVNNYSDSKSETYFENVSISDINGFKEITVNGQDTSFNRNINGEKRKINCIRFSEIIDKYNLTEIDGLFVDVEGHEYIIFNDIFNNCIIPIKFIRFEFWWAEDRRELDLLFEKNNYELYQCDESYADKIAIHKDYLNIFNGN